VPPLPDPGNRLTGAASPQCPRRCGAAGRLPSIWRKVMRPLLMS